MRLAAVVLVAAAAGSGVAPAPAGAEADGAARRPPSGACRVVEPSPRRAARRPALRERAALLRSRTRLEAALAADPRTARLPAIGRGPFYSAARTLDLELGVTVGRSVPAGAGVELRLFTPRGHLYQTLSLRASLPPETSSEAGSPAARRRPGPPGLLIAALPVAGTAIVNHSLYGPWTVEPHLADDPRPCGDAVRFWIGE
jgi:hypothetical protein